MKSRQKKLVIVGLVGVVALGLVIVGVGVVWELVSANRDGRRQALAEQVLGALDNYYQSREQQYPWNIFEATREPSGRLRSAQDGWGWLEELSQSGFLTGEAALAVADESDFIFLKEGGVPGETYLCYPPSSRKFKKQAADVCQKNLAPNFQDQIICTTRDGDLKNGSGQVNLICLTK
jgi:hypothetical protein